MENIIKHTYSQARITVATSQSFWQISDISFNNFPVACF